MEALGVSVIGLAAYAANFIILVVLLRLFLYKPVKAMLARRQQRIADGLEAADRAQNEAEGQRAAFERELAAARDEAQQEARAAAEATERMRGDVLQAARDEAEEIKARAREEAERERQQVAADLQREAGELALLIARKVIADAVDPAAHRALVDRALADIGRMREPR
ncbi:MAG: F0F1 ATP synthase subunit B [Spirochaetaceae bacterium]|nr:F0F1 ATP synthase subunit B [Spirochaetaceae bacterium]